MATRVSETVGSVARMTGLTVRTLHHYDAIGLLTPSERSPSGYRLYSPADLERLQEILLFRELGFPLDDIAAMIDDPDYDRPGALRRHGALIRRKIDHLRAMAASVDRALEASMQGETMSGTEMFEVFGDFDPREYEDEVKNRWGDSDAYRESERRTAAYGKDDWALIIAEAQQIAQEFADAMTQGVGADTIEAMDIAERHRRHINERFYPCSHEAHNALGEMYVADQRFTDYWDGFAPGLAGFVSEAITANALR